jgi:hypothetical protein
VHKDIKEKQGDNKDPLDRVMYQEMERRQNDLRRKQAEKDKQNSTVTGESLAVEGD